MTHRDKLSQSTGKAPAESEWIVVILSGEHLMGQILNFDRFDQDWPETFFLITPEFIKSYLYFSGSLSK